jgi:hypothetical protein
MKVKLTVDVPPEAKKWLHDHNGCEGTAADFRTVFDGLITAFLEDLESDYGKSFDGFCPECGEKLPHENGACKASSR